VSDEMKQMLMAAAVLMAQVYVTEPWKFTAFARFWDWVARVAGLLANKLGWLAMHARANYYDSIAIGE
jgi:hypothetical protein